MNKFKENFKKQKTEGGALIGILVVYVRICVAYNMGMSKSRIKFFHSILHARLFPLSKAKVFGLAFDLRNAFGLNMNLV